MLLIRALPPAARAPEEEPGSSNTDSNVEPARILPSLVGAERPKTGKRYATKRDPLPRGRLVFYGWIFGHLTTPLGSVVGLRTAVWVN
jgi:hypothetical protein